MALQELDYTVSYITGPKNFLADALSRLLTQLEIPDKHPQVEEFDQVVLSALHEIAPVTDLQLEVIEMCHNSMVGHGGLSRTMLKLDMKNGLTWNPMFAISLEVVPVVRR